jgi:hypothetical protein
VNLTESKQDAIIKKLEKQLADPVVDWEAGSLPMTPWRP